MRGPEEPSAGLAPASVSSVGEPLKEVARHDSVPEIRQPRRTLPETERSLRHSHQPFRAAEAPTPHPCPGASPPALLCLKRGGVAQCRETQPGALPPHASLPWRLWGRRGSGCEAGVSSLAGGGGLKLWTTGTPGRSGGGQCLSARAPRARLGHVPAWVLPFYLRRLAGRFSVPFPAALPTTMADQRAPTVSSPLLRTRRLSPQGPRAACVRQDSPHSPCAVGAGGS